jgi:hypothetical protein
MPLMTILKHYHLYQSMNDNEFKKGAENILKYYFLRKPSNKKILSSFSVLTQKPEIRMLSYIAIAHTLNKVLLTCLFPKQTASVVL